MQMVPHPHQKRQQLMRCYVCGSQLEFKGDPKYSQREFHCPSCNYSRRYSDLAGIILDTFSPDTSEPLRQAAEKFAHLSIFEAQAYGPFHETFCHLPQYFCSEYFDHIEKGVRNPAGVMCQDLEDLTFSSGIFDLVITQDVFEHVKTPELAFREIHRILKPGGFHIFTIPFHEGRPTLRRVIIQDGKELHKLPPVYHGDPLRENGALVCSDFGQDMVTLLETIGFKTEAIPCSMWYSQSEIPYISDDKEYQKYTDCITKKNMLEYFKYNSWVFRSRKN